MVLRLTINSGTGTSSGRGSGGGGGGCGSAAKPALPYATLDDSYTFGVLVIMALPLLGAFAIFTSKTFLFFIFFFFFSGDLAFLGGSV
jgi:hypothetical protein